MILPWPTSGIWTRRSRGKDSIEMKPRLLSIRTRMSESLRPGSPSCGRVSDPISSTLTGSPGRTARVARRAALASGVFGAAASRVSSR